MFLPLGGILDDLGTFWHQFGTFSVCFGSPWATFLWLFMALGINLVVFGCALGDLGHDLNHMFAPIGNIFHTFSNICYDCKSIVFFHEMVDTICWSEPFWYFYVFHKALCYSINLHEMVDTFFWPEPVCYFYVFRKALCYSINFHEMVDA